MTIKMANVVHRKFKEYLRQYGHTQKWLSDESEVNVFDINLHINRGATLKPEDEKKIMAVLRKYHRGFKKADIYET